MTENTAEDDQDIERAPSKSQVKRDCDALQKTGEELIRLKTSDLEGLDLPERLYEAVLEARRLKSRSGLKRQRQYIGKVMREIDHGAVESQLQALHHRNDRSNATFHRTELLRDRLIAGDKDAITELHQQYHDIDHQHLNQLVRQANKEAQQNKPPAAARKLFKYLREFIGD